MSIFESALQMMLVAHYGQTDKSGSPYLLHPLRVMHSVDDYLEKVIALLHDVLEDSNFTKEDLKKFIIFERVIKSIDILTKRENEDYKDYISRIINENDEHAINVKIADLRDNMNMERLEILTDKDLTRLKKYHTALDRLLSHKALMKVKEEADIA